ncbi:MAG: hypothetical protein E7035_03080 [Verrucomicrobiaceae bacterium]|nr:hypothetical protein [Verrucomicrobiaceae bacterium]
MNDKIFKIFFYIIAIFLVYGFVVLYLKILEAPYLNLNTLLADSLVPIGCKPSNSKVAEIELLEDKSSKDRGYLNLIREYSRFNEIENASILIDKVDIPLNKVIAQAYIKAYSFIYLKANIKLDSFLEATIFYSVVYSESRNPIHISKAFFYCDKLENTQKRFAFFEIFKQFEYKGLYSDILKFMSKYFYINYPASELFLEKIYTECKIPANIDVFFKYRNIQYFAKYMNDYRGGKFSRSQTIDKFDAKIKTLSNPKWKYQFIFCLDYITKCYIELGRKDKAEEFVNDIYSDNKSNNMTSSYFIGLKKQKVTQAYILLGKKNKAIDNIISADSFSQREKIIIAIIDTYISQKEYQKAVDLLKDLKKWRWRFLLHK